MSLDERYHPIELPDGEPRINEIDLQRTNGVLEMIEESLHYTYTVFPGSSVKAKNQYSMF